MCFNVNYLDIKVKFQNLYYRMSPNECLKYLLNPVITVSRGKTFKKFKSAFNVLCTKVVTQTGPKKMKQEYRGPPTSHLAISNDFECEHIERRERIRVLRRRPCIRQYIKGSCYRWKESSRHSYCQVELSQVRLRDHFVGVCIFLCKGSYST